MDVKVTALHAMREATREQHDNLEKSLLITLPHAGRNEYIRYIAALWGWLAPFEERLWNAPWPPEMAASERGRKRFWLEDDLRAAGLDAAALKAIPVSPFLPELDSLPACFGLAYVIEGAQLGTQVLRKSLAPALEPWTPRWLQGYGQDTSKKWRTFIDCTERFLDTPESCRIAADSAHQAFAQLASWFKACGAARDDCGNVQNPAILLI